MQLGMIADPVEESFRLAAEEGLDFVEFCINGHDTGEQLETLLPKLRNWIKTYHVQVGSIGRWKSQILLPDGIISENEISVAKRLLQICDALGCPNYICGCNYSSGITKLENYNRAVDFFAHVIRSAPSGTDVSVYNCKKMNFVSTPESWSFILEQLPQLGIKFDPANSRYAGEDYLAVLAQWAPRVRHVHLKGSIMVDGVRIDDPPAGMDQTDWNSVIGILRNAGYDRGLSLEPHSDIWKGPMMRQGIHFSVNYFEKLIIR